MQKRDIISFPVDIARIIKKLEDEQPGEQIHPIELGNVRSASDTQGVAVEEYWIGRIAIAYGFPSGRPLSRSGGNIVEYSQPTGQLLKQCINCET